MEVSSDMMKEEWYVNSLMNPMPVLNPLRKQNFSLDGMDDWVISVSREIADTNGENLGVLLIDVKYQALHEYLQNQETGKNSDIVILDEDNRIVYYKEIPYDISQEKYLKNLKFYSDYDKSQNLRAVINFDENIYENQKNDNVQREWFAVSKVLESQKEGKLNVYYDLVNTDFSRTKKFIYSFNLVNNFFNKNKAEILYVNIYNKSNYPIENIEFKGYNFKNVTKKNDRAKHYELLVGDVNLEDNLVIRFK